jgi:hypothetical protein
LEDYCAWKFLSVRRRFVILGNQGITFPSWPRQVIRKAYAGDATCLFQPPTSNIMDLQSVELCGCFNNNSAHARCFFATHICVPQYNLRADFSSFSQFIMDTKGIASKTICIAFSAPFWELRMPNSSNAITLNAKPHFFGEYAGAFCVQNPRFYT